MAEEIEDRLTRFLAQISIDANAMSEQRDKANEDMRFVHVDGGQWEGFMTETFTHRVRMEFDVVSNFISRIKGDWSGNRTGVLFDSDDAATSDDDATLLTGMYRADFTDGDGEMSVDQAVNEAIDCGYGAFHIKTIYEDEGDPESELQRVVWEPIYNAYNTVFFDQGATRIDKRDARWCTLLTPFTRGAFKEEFPDFEPSSAYTPRDRKEFNFQQGHIDIVYVATRYEIIKKKTRAFIYNNLRDGQVEVFWQDDHDDIADELKKNPNYEFVRERRVERRTVEMSRFSGTDFLMKPQRIVGKFIPVIPVYAFRSYSDGKEWYRGAVRKMKDAARVVNVQVSGGVETAATGNRSLPIFHPTQVENATIRQGWANQNGKSFMLSDAFVPEDGSPTIVGPVGYTKPPEISQASQQLLEFVTSFVRDTTGGAPQETLNPDASGKLVEAINQREDRNTIPIFDNIKIALKHSGGVYQAIAAEAYDMPRMVRTMGPDGARAKSTLFKLVFDSESGRVVQSNTLRGKRFRAYPDTGPQHESARKQTVEELKGVLTALVGIEGMNDYISTIVDVIVQNIGGVGMGPIKELGRKRMLLAGTTEPETDEEEAFVAQASEAQQQPDPNAELVAAMSENQAAEARERDAATLQKTADAQKKAAEAAKIQSDIENEGLDRLIQIRQQILGQANRGLQRVTGP